MKFPKLYATNLLHLNIIALFFHITSHASSVFYNSEDDSINIKKYHFSHSSYLETTYGDSNVKKGKENTIFNRFQSGRLNARSILQAQDTQNQYSALLDLQIGTDVNEDQSTLFYINQGYIEMQNSQSQPIQTKVRIGIQHTANRDLAVNSSTMMKNNQGINGNWYRFIRMPVVNQLGGYNPTFILQSNMFASQGFTDATFLYSKNGGNLNFVQPSPNWSQSNVGIGFSMNRIYGLKLAFSFQPSQNTGNFGINANGGYDRRGIQIEQYGNSMFTKNLTSVVLNYLNEFHGVALNSSIGYETAGFHTNNQIVNIERNKLSQYTGGVNISYMGFTAGASYSNAGKSMLLKQNTNHINSFSAHNAENSLVKNATTLTDIENLSKNTKLLEFKNSYNYDYGLSYAISRFQFGVAHAKSYFSGNKFNATIFSFSDDISSSKNIKLTTIYEVGTYKFDSEKYFVNTGNIVSIQSIPQTKGIFGSFGIKVSI